MMCCRKTVSQACSASSPLAAISFGRHAQTPLTVPPMPSLKRSSESIPAKCAQGTPVRNVVQSIVRMDPSIYNHSAATIITLAPSRPAHATASVSVLGRNEGGLTLDKGAVDAVLKSVHRYFDKSPTADWMAKSRLRAPARKVASKVQQVVNMVIADANKPFVLQHPHALDDLLTSLLLDEDNSRRD
eukprot:COSAG01_NODE_11210_length_1981_cov_2.139214_2_plen_186_part_01